MIGALGLRARFNGPRPVPRVARSGRRTQVSGQRRGSATVTCFTVLPSTANRRWAAVISRLRGLMPAHAVRGSANAGGVPAAAAMGGSTSLPSSKTLMRPSFMPSIPATAPSASALISSKAASVRPAGARAAAPGGAA